MRVQRLGLGSLLPLKFWPSNLAEPAARGFSGFSVKEECMLLFHSHSPNNLYPLNTGFSHRPLHLKSQL